jgi:hypothetical protein
VVKGFGTALIVLGALMLLLPVVLSVWAFHTYSIGIAIESLTFIVIWCLLAAIAIGGGVWLRYRGT